VDPRERYFDPEETLRMALDRRASRIWTLLPCLVTAVTRNGNCVEAQPTINGRIRKQDGTWQILQLPKIVDCPILWPGGGGLTLLFPLTPNVDEVLVAFSARCFDSWYASGFQVPAGNASFNPANNPPAWRMHNLSDGFAIPGIRSWPRAFGGGGDVVAIDPNVCRLRTDDDTFYYEMNPTAKSFKVVAPGGITLNNVTIDSSGNVVSPVNITADGTLTGETAVIEGTGGSTVRLGTHKTSEVQSGSGESGPPVTGT
jgi:Phage protein Gp138 N-terminal domain